MSDRSGDSFVLNIIVTIKGISKPFLVEGVTPLKSWSPTPFVLEDYRKVMNFPIFVSSPPRIRITVEKEQEKIYLLT